MANRTTSSTLLAGRVGLVTGAGSPYGIGRSTVIALAAADASAIYATDLNMENMESLALRIKEVNPACAFEARPLDVCDEAETVQILEEITRKHGRFDFFIANAGFINVTNINNVQTSNYQKAMDVMAQSVFFAVKHASRAMAVTSGAKPVSKGEIVVIASAAGTIGSFSDMVYAGAKHAACGLVRAGAVSLSASNIRVNAVAPGATQTSLLVNSSLATTGDKFYLKMTEEDAKDSLKGFIEATNAAPGSQYSYNRIAQPDEVANIAVFLASDLSSAVNGHVLVADSGKTQGACGETYMGPVPAVEPLDLS